MWESGVNSPSEFSVKGTEDIGSHNPFNDITTPENIQKSSPSNKENRAWKSWWSQQKTSGYKKRIGKYQMSTNIELSLSDGAYQWLGLQELTLQRKGDNEIGFKISYVRLKTV